jgi:hypothetical protein
MKSLRSMVLALVAGAVTSLAAGASPLLAQEAGGSPGVVDAGILEAAVTGHASEAQETRSRLVDLLRNDRVQSVAEARGIDLAQVEARVATLADEEIQHMEAMVTESTAALAQSNTITISVYTVIIILLILILVT